MFVVVKFRDNVLEFLVDIGATVTLVSKSAIENTGPITSVEPLKPEVLIADSPSKKYTGHNFWNFLYKGHKSHRKLLLLT